MHTALNMLIAQTATRSKKPAASKAGTTVSRSKGADSPGRHELAVLKGLADEAELTGDQAAADTYHQERVLAPANAQVSFMCIQINAIVLSPLYKPELQACAVAAYGSSFCLPSLLKGKCLPTVRYR